MTTTLRSTEPRAELEPYGLLTFGAILALSAASLSPLSSVMALVPALLTFWGELTDRRRATIVGLLTSVLFVSEAPGGVRVPLLVGVAALTGWALHRATNPRGAAIGVAMVPLLMLVVLGLGWLMRPPETVAGQYAIYEQLCIFAYATVLLLERKVTPEGAADEARTFHLTLVCVALVSGLDAAMNIGADPSAFSGTRQVDSNFGGSNYVAAILALAIVSCCYCAVSQRTDRILNIASGVACTVLFIPQESRTSTATLAAMGVFILLQQRRLTTSWVVAASVAFILMLNVSKIPGLERFQQADASFHDLNGRVALWRFAVEQINDNFWIGTGPGRLTDSLQMSGFGLFYVHDIWLSFVAQYGILIVGLIVLGLWKLFQRPTSRYVHVLALTALIISTFEPAAETLKIGTIFVLIVAVGVGHSRATISCSTTTPEHGMQR